MGFPPLRAVLLDNNGTCFDDLHVAYESAVNICTTFGAPRPTLQQYRDEMDSNWREWYWKYGVPRWVIGEQMNALRVAYYAEHGHTAHYRPDVPKFLCFCLERGLKVAMVSAEIRSILISSLSRGGLAGYFSHIEAEAWPKTPGLVRTLERLEVLPEQAVYVDDSAEGLRSARTIGMRTIGFTNSTAYASEERIRTAEPDVCARNFTEVHEIVRSWS